MPLDLEYYPAMRYRMPVLTVLLITLSTLCASAQVNGVPPSVTSFGFGGHQRFNGPPPSVTSLGPQGVTPSRGGIHQPPFRSQPGMHHHQHQGYAYPYYVPYYLPYYPAEAYDGPVADEAAPDQQDDPAQDQGGPTIFDRRGPGTRAFNEYPADPPRAAAPRAAAPRPAASLPAAPASPQQPAQPSVANSAPEPPRVQEIAAQPPTILIFKDGHQQEISNYAIVGTNLFDLTPGHRMKIPLSDLDVTATEKANDDQGIDFKLPELPNGN